jgi:hypothetical protein
MQEQEKFNSEVTKVLDQMNAPINKTLPSSTTHLWELNQVIKIIG